jgi:hypothetical protein
MKEQGKQWRLLLIGLGIGAVLLLVILVIGLGWL